MRSPIFRWIPIFFGKNVHSLSVEPTGPEYSKWRCHVGNSSPENQHLYFQVFATMIFDLELIFGTTACGLMCYDMAVKHALSAPQGGEWWSLSAASPCSPLSEFNMCLCSRLDYCSQCLPDLQLLLGWYMLFACDLTLPLSRRGKYISKPINTGRGAIRLV